MSSKILNLIASILFLFSVISYAKLIYSSEFDVSIAYESIFTLLTAIYFATRANDKNE